MALPRGIQREIDFGAEGPQDPLTHGRRGDLPPISYFGGDIPWTLRAELQRLDKDLDIIYDRFAAPHQFAPSHHLVRWIHKGAVRQEDRFVLIFSLQFDRKQQWPEGEPRKPGMWVLDEYRQWKHEKEHPEEMAAHNRKIRREHKKKLVAFDRHLHEEFVKPRGKMVNTHRRAAERRRKAAPKAVVQMGAGIEGVRDSGIKGEDAA